MKFHPNGKWIYVLNENDVTVTLFSYDAQAGTMSAKQTEAAVPKEQLARELRFSASEIRMHPNGRFAYSASRGHDTITAFRIDQKSGELTVVERENIRGATPRNFNLDPTGKWLLAAGQDSHTLASFAVNQDTGELTHNRHIVHAPAPICVVIAKPHNADTMIHCQLTGARSGFNRMFGRTLMNSTGKKTRIATSDRTHNREPRIHCGSD